jgi:hypothetical protein
LISIYCTDIFFFIVVNWWYTLEKNPYGIYRLIELGNCKRTSKQSELVLFPVVLSCLLHVKNLAMEVAQKVTNIELQRSNGKRKLSVESSCNANSIWELMKQRRKTWSTQCPLSVHLTLCLSYSLSGFVYSVVLVFTVVLIVIQCLICSTYLVPYHLLFFEIPIKKHCFYLITHFVIVVCGVTLYKKKKKVVCGGGVLLDFYIFIF